MGYLAFLAVVLIALGGVTWWAIRTRQQLHDLRAQVGERASQVATEAARDARSVEEAKLKLRSEVKELQLRRQRHLDVAQGRRERELEMERSIHGAQATTAQISRVEVPDWKDPLGTSSETAKKSVQREMEQKAKVESIERNHEKRVEAIMKGSEEEHRTLAQIDADLRRAQEDLRYVELYGKLPPR